MRSFPFRAVRSRVGLGVSGGKECPQQRRSPYFLRGPFPVASIHVPIVPVTVFLDLGFSHSVPSFLNQNFHAIFSTFNLGNLPKRTPGCRVLLGSCSTRFPWRFAPFGAALPWYWVGTLPSPSLSTPPGAVMQSLESKLTGWSNWEISVKAGLHVSNGPRWILGDRDVGV